MLTDFPAFQAECDELLRSFAPTEVSNKRRKQIHDFAVDVIRRKLPCVNVFGVGSSALKTYLPESDVDLVLLTDDEDPNSDELRNILGSIFNALCEEISLKDEDRSTYKTMTIRNIELVNGRKKVAHCVVNNIGVDVTVNQVSSLASITFLEEADRCIGGDHLLKRSVLLIKVPCPSFSPSSRVAFSRPFDLTHVRPPCRVAGVVLERKRQVLRAADHRREAGHVARVCHHRHGPQPLQPGRSSRLSLFSPFFALASYQPSPPRPAFAYVTPPTLCSRRTATGRWGCRSATRSVCC